MSKINHNLSAKKKRQIRVRSKIHGTALCPRLSVFRSNQHFYLQAIDDDKGLTLACANDLDKKKKFIGTKTEKALVIAQEIAKQLKVKKIKQLVFDRSHCRYHGRVRAAAETLREAGLKL
ncbi:MAG: 50S ribosomal protein L18 [Patescibacteria group bacterium]